MWYSWLAIAVEGKGTRWRLGRVIGVVFDVAEPLGSWQSVENVGIACWQNFESLAELKLS